MRKGRDGEKKNGKNGKKKREKKENADENSGHYVIASSRPPEHRPLERCLLVPKLNKRKSQTDAELCQALFSLLFDLYTLCPRLVY